MADAKDPVQRPHDWDKCVSVAYLRILGYSQEDSAKGVGVGVRSVIRWEQCSWWRDAKEEAADRWMNDLTAAARRNLLESVKSGGTRPETMLDILERVDDRLLPAKQRHELSGPDGAPIPTEVRVSFVDTDADDD